MKAVWRLARLTPHVLHGLWIVKRRFERNAVSGRRNADRDRIGDRPIPCGDQPVQRIA